ncbi:hypothetical protein CEXT_813421 [Caerostris extrusa]|uniref:Uncharacterized protein n=1 Tax=Caerostris extrusa TaxID=172846 RepID=A0AAV4XIN8_CAEEX|nr:hypothetical protein CEXT_813421 [Caerostris extrusa]
MFPGTTLRKLMGFSAARSRPLFRLQTEEENIKVFYPLPLVPIARGNSLFDGYSNHVPGRVIRCRRTKSSENRSIWRVAHLNGNWQQMQLRMGAKALPPLVNLGGRRQEPT